MTRRIVSAALVLLVVVLACFLLLGFINRQRVLSASLQCKQNLKGIGPSLEWYSASNAGRFPLATVPNAQLSPEKRLSWLVETWHLRNQAHLLLNKAKAWNDAENLHPKAEFMDVGEQPIGIDTQLRCPADASPGFLGDIGVTNYVGIAGIGGDYAASLPIADPWSGIFGYDRICRPKDITNGLSNIMAVAETLTDNGPWTAAGRPTVRGLDQDGLPYLGKDGQFNSGHYTRSYFTWTKHSYTTNILFADGSVRPFADDIDPATFEAMATIHGPDKRGDN
jgi:prepilin-type processing-associated H-X9-DG protein